MIGIYKIENLVNGKVYIGQSTDIQKRWTEHRRISRKISESYRRSYIHSAIKKYGLENFSFEVIEKCNIKELDEKEIKWIAYYHSYINDPLCNGYNLTIGGQGTRKISDEDIQDIVALWEQGLTIGEIRIALGFCQESIVQYLKKYSKTYSPEESNKRCTIRPVGVHKIFNQYNLKGELLAQFASIRQASKILKIDRNVISGNLRYQTKICKGFIFVLEEEEQIDGLKRHLNMEGNRKGKPVMKLTLDEELVDCYWCEKEAALSCNKKDGMVCIRACCKGEKDQVYGYKWKFLDESVLVLNKNSILYN